MKRALLLVAVISSLAILTYVKLWAGGSPAGSTQPANLLKTAPQVGFRAPDFQLTGLDGKKYSLDGMRGKPLVINFWASWCPPCRLEAPELVKLYNQYQGRLEILAINLTFQDSLEDMRAFVDESGVTFPVLLDKEGAVTKAYQIQGIPTAFFVNKEGVIIDRVVGYSGPDLLASKFQRLAGGK